MALTKLTSNLIEGGTGTDWVTAIQTSNFTAEAGKGYFVNTTSQVLYVNLPVGVVGMEITIQDYAGTFATNRVILNANGSEKIQGSALEGKITTNNATAVLIYQDATKGWTSQDVKLNVTEISWATPTGQSLIYSTPSPQSSQGTAATTFPTTTFTATLAGSEISGTATIAGLPSGITAAQTITGSGVGNALTVTLTGTFPATDSLNTALTLSGLTVVTPFTVDYLVVAGGGGGGGTSGLSGGGGAGGLRTSYGSTSGGGGAAETTLTLVSATNYTVTVGAGGAGANASVFPTGGIDSVFHTITSNGGGTGGGNTQSAGGNGGSGGGSLGTDGGATPGAGTTGQGFSGGRGDGTSGLNDNRGGGGGGAAAAGAGGKNITGNGGAGLEVNIIGTTGNYYAGGGGGGKHPTAGSYGSGGIGGGGAAGAPGTNGTSNTGGGGGMSNNATGATGGSGIVILRYPSAKTITNPGSGLTFTTATVGSDKVTTFISGTGNIQFN